MEGWIGTLSVLGGLLLRFGVPIAITALLAWALRRLDARWQLDAERQLAAQAAPAYNPSKPCWQVHQCSQEKRKDCPAYKDPNSPCWQHFRNSRGELPQRCLGCDVFKQAPALQLV
ncbi:MAG: hypothetical protein PVF49_12710 [Anaerolineales bacterium]